MFNVYSDGFASYGRLRADLSTRAIPKRDAVERFYAHWDRFHHIGEVPDEEQRQEILNQNACDRFNNEQRAESLCGVLGSSMAAEASQDKGPSKLDEDTGSSDGGESLYYPGLVLVS